MKTLFFVSAALALVISGCGGSSYTGPCYTINGSAAAGLQECYYLVDTNGKSCASLGQLDGHCPTSGYVGCCVHADGSAVCYSQDSTGTYQAECSAPDSWKLSPP